jgi:hypothetical protein
MKTKTTTVIKLPEVQIDKSLEQYRNKVFFPEKLAKANKMLKTTKLPFAKPTK